MKKISEILLLLGISLVIGTGLSLLLFPPTQKAHAVDIQPQTTIYLLGQGSEVRVLESTAYVDKEIITEPPASGWAEFQDVVKPGSEAIVDVIKVKVANVSAVLTDE